MPEDKYTAYAEHATHKDESVEEGLERLTQELENFKEKIDDEDGELNGHLILDLKAIPIEDIESDPNA